MLSVRNDEEAGHEHIHNADEHKDTAICESIYTKKGTGDESSRKRPQNRDETQNGESNVSRGNQIAAGGEGKTIGGHVRNHIHPAGDELLTMALLSGRIEGASWSAVRCRSGKNGKTLTAGTDHVIDGEDAQLVVEELSEVSVVHPQSEDDHDQEGNEGEEVPVSEEEMKGLPHALQQLARKFGNQHKSNVLQHRSRNVQVARQITRNLVQHPNDHSNGLGTTRNKLVC